MLNLANNSLLGRQSNALLKSTSIVANTLCSDIHFPVLNHFNQDDFTDINFSESTQKFRHNIIEEIQQWIAKKASQKFMKNITRLLQA